MSDNRFDPQSFCEWLETVLKENGIETHGVQVLGNSQEGYWFRGMFKPEALRGIGPDVSPFKWQKL